jgi:hypothetical protein
MGFGMKFSFFLYLIRKINLKKAILRLNLALKPIEFY